MEVIPEWEDVIKSQCKELSIGQNIPGLDLLKAYGDVEEPLYIMSDVVKLLGIEQNKVNKVLNEWNEGDEYVVVSGQRLLTTEGIIALAHLEKTTVTRYIRKVIKNCVKILQFKYPKILAEVLEKTKAENAQLHASFKAEINALYDQVGFITRAKHEVEDDLEETKAIMYAKEAEILDLRNRERALMAKAIQAHTEDPRDSERLLFDSLVSKYAKKLYVYPMGEGLHLTMRNNTTKEPVEIIPIVNEEEFKQLLSELSPNLGDAGEYIVDIEQIKETINDMRRKTADIKALNDCTAFLYTVSGGDFIDKHIN